MCAPRAASPSARGQTLRRVPRCQGVRDCPFPPDTRAADGAHRTGDADASLLPATNVATPPPRALVRQGFWCMPCVHGSTWALHEMLAGMPHTLATPTGQAALTNPDDYCLPGCGGPCFTIAAPNIVSLAAAEGTWVAAAVPWPPGTNCRGIASDPLRIADRRSRIETRVHVPNKAHATRDVGRRSHVLKPPFVRV